MKYGILVLALLSSDAAAQAMKVRDTVYLRIPLSAIELRATATGLRGARWRADVSSIGGSLAVNGDTTWRTTRLPDWSPFRLTKFSVDKDLTEAELDLDFGPSPSSRIEVRLPTLRPGDIERLVITKARLAEAQEAAYAEVAAATFVGPLAAVPDSTQRLLLEFATLVASATQLRSESFRDLTFFVVDLGPSRTVYNDVRLNENQRLVEILNSRIFTIAKAFANAVADVPSLQGLKVEMEVPHRNFVSTPAGLEQIDKLAIYFPLDLIKRFADLDITSQDLLDGSTVVLNANRIKVDLRGGA